MALFKPAQIKKFVNGSLYLGNLSVSFTGVTSIANKRIQTALSNALLGGAANGLNLPSQDSITPVTLKRREGYHMTSPRNFVNVYDAYKRTIVTAGGNEVYGRLQIVSPGSTPTTVAVQTAGLAVESIVDIHLGNGDTPGSVVASITNARNSFNTTNPAPRSPQNEAAFNVYVSALAAANAYMASAGGGATIAGIVDAVNAVNDEAVGATSDYLGVVFYSNVAGVETATSITQVMLDGANGFNFALGYVYSFDNLPSDFATGVSGSFVSDDPLGSTANSEQREPLTYVAPNNFGALAYGVRPNTTVFVHVNGISFNSNQVTVFEIEPVTNKLIWLPTSPYPLDDEDNVIVTYVSNGVATV